MKIINEGVGKSGKNYKVALNFECFLIKNERQPKIAGRLITVITNY